MVDPVVTILSMIIVGQVSLSIPLLLARSSHSASCFPLALFLLASGIMALNSTVSSLFPDWYQLYTALAFPQFFILCPSLWLYIEAITSSEPCKSQFRMGRDFLLLWPALIVSVLILLLQQDLFTVIFIDDGEVSDPLAIGVVLSILVMMLLWLGQCAMTLVAIVRQLALYRKQLNNFFSNNDDKQLRWLNWLLFIAVTTWLFSLSAVFLSNLFSHYLFTPRVEVLLSLLLIWTLSYFGLQQKAVLAEYNEVKRPDESEKIKDGNQRAEKKYQRSALGKEQAERIAEKISSAMKKDKLYLDASLTLHKLASYVAISPNYISQTLNETLSINFFDYVNQWRIEAAKPLILANQNSVTNIALEVGFNARSSFYKAFKQETGKTPSEFRKLSE